MQLKFGLYLGNLIVLQLNDVQPYIDIASTMLYMWFFLIWVADASLSEGALSL